MPTAYERIEAAIAREILDRVPVTFWRHFPVDDQNPTELAISTLEYQAQYGFDLVKVTPASSFCIKEYGVQDEWQGNLEGTRTYTSRSVHSLKDWEALAPLDPYTGLLADQLTCLMQIKQGLGPEVPMVQLSNVRAGSFDRQKTSRGRLPFSITREWGGTSCCGV